VVLAPDALEVEEGSQLAIVGERLPAPAAHDAQRLGRGIALAHQHRAGHQRAASDAVLTMQKGSTAARNVVEHPVNPLLHLGVRKAVMIGRGQVQQLDASIRQRRAVIFGFETTIYDGGNSARLQVFDLASSEGAADGELRGDLGVVELLGLEVGYPLQQAREDAQPQPPQR
jgi:hypothetical protein